MPLKVLQEELSEFVEVRMTDNPLELDTTNGQMPPPEKLVDMNWADIILVSNILKFGGPYTARTCAVAKGLGKFLHMDTDDLLTDLYPEHHLFSVYKEQKLDEVTKFCYSISDLVTVTQVKFAERIKPFCTKILAVIRNTIDYNLPCWNTPRQETKYTRIGWAGGVHHRTDVEVFGAVPHLVNQKVGRENVKWNLYGHPPPNQESKGWEANVWPEYKQKILKAFKGQPNYQIYYALPPDQYGVYYADMDVAIAPLQMNSFNDSKCWRPGQKLLMYNGELKKVEDIHVGDKLMGPDSTVRTVKTLYHGVGNMYKISPKKGNPLYVTGNHILRLKANDKNVLKSKPQYIEVTVKDYLNLSKTDKINYRLYRTAINFNELPKLAIDPYFVGIMLGDGSLTQGRFAITSMDQEIVDYFINKCKEYNSDIVIRKDQKENNRAATYRAVREERNCHIKNPLSVLFEKINLNNIACEDKFIPHCYKIASYENRLQILAGLMDTDGCLHNKTFFCFSNKSKKLVEDTAFIARSVGLYVSPTEEFEIKERKYYRIRISGDTDIIPTKLKRKQATKRLAKRDSLTTGFTVEHIGLENCVGIQVDKDGLVIMDDFTITHNSDIKVAEAARYKIPLIASNVGCYNETIKNGVTGYLIDPDAPKTEWVRLLTKVCKDKKHRQEMGQNLHYITEKLFDARANAKGRYELYLRAIKDLNFPIKLE